MSTLVKNDGSFIKIGQFFAKQSQFWCYPVLYVRHDVISQTTFWLGRAYSRSLYTKDALQYKWNILHLNYSKLVPYSWYTLRNPNLFNMLFADWMQFGVKKDPTLRLTQVFLLCYSKVKSDIKRKSQFLVKIVMLLCSVLIQPTVWY